MLEELLKYDKELFRFLNAMGNTTWDGLWLFITNKYNSFALYAVLLYLAYRNMGPKRTLLLVVTVALLVLVNDQLANFFKYGVERLRPCYDPDIYPSMRLVKESCGGRFGFYSAHAANSFAIAYIFSALLRAKFRYIGIFLMLWAFLMAYSRVYIGVHFPLDVLAGGLIGLILSWIAVKLYIFALQKFPL